MTFPCVKSLSLCDSEIDWIQDEDAAEVKESRVYHKIEIFRHFYICEFRYQQQSTNVYLVR